jgi:hypothetical protein
MAAREAPAVGAHPAAMTRATAAAAIIRRRRDLFVVLSVYLGIRLTSGEQHPERAVVLAKKCADRQEGAQGRGPADAQPMVAHRRPAR